LAPQMAISGGETVHKGATGGIHDSGHDD